MYHDVTYAQPEEAHKINIALWFGRRPQSVDIVKTCAEVFDVTKGEMYSGQRHRRIVRARWAAMLIMKDHTIMSLPEIGRRLQRDHTTVLHGIRGARHLISEQQDGGYFSAKYREVETLLPGLRK